MLEVNNKADLTKQVCQNKRVLALFASTWCPYCQSFVRNFDANIAPYKFDLILRVNMDDYDSPLWDEYNVAAVPTVILFENGDIKDRLDSGSGVGLREAKFKEWLKTVNPQ
ncbi:MAG: thioredoxin family protein [Candidatus Bathyarchaeia archaeon]|jgi:thioredoxin-like negative regulator of GroEL